MRVATALGLLAFAPMAAEALLSARHERRLREAGALEPADDVIGTMQVAYPACFAAICTEAWLRDRPLDRSAAAGLATFAAAKAIKYWAIATLGPRWTFRVLVPPGAPRRVSGPYRWMNHPNYLGVAGEIAGLALAGGARLSGPIAVAGFGLLLAARVRVEERALAGGQALTPGPDAGP